MENNEPTKVTYLLQSEVDELQEYSTTLPTGVTEGKKWKRKVDGKWYLGEYGKIEEGKQTDIIWSKIVVCENEDLKRKSIESQNIVDSLYPVGEERWIKVKYLNQEKAMKSLEWGASNYGEITKNDKKRGFQMTAIGIRDEYTPQISAIYDLKGEVLSVLLSAFTDTDNPIIERVNELFKAKMDEIKQHTIKTEVPIL